MSESVDVAARELAQTAMRPALGRIERMVGEDRIVVEGPVLKEIVSSSGIRSMEATCSLRPAQEPDDDSRAVVVTLSDPYWPDAQTDITLPEGEQNPYITEQEQAAVMLGVDAQLFDAVRVTLGHGLADAQYAAMYPSKMAPAQSAAQAGMEDAASRTRADEPELTVYTTPDCPGCTMTKRQLDKAGVVYKVVDLSGRPDLIKQFQAEGLRQAPIIEMDGQRTAGFDPTRIKAIVAAATPQQAPGSSGPSNSGDGGDRRTPQHRRPRARGEGMHQ